ncbi:hypothetical protein EXIGLDRAFT_842325 [Exidia glandulosa HHB12029]|uniref:F-box domain-containing protein n=1 Tax=Exidia glandulosa HHB12029 TaxID=1314781 RepID=A0A165DDD0_EXIGL|nr:hypothetical protein EXIGLDRAFT_842325 [Exidia glandulosa HHB12029]
MNSTSISVLPAELVDRFIDFVAYDRIDLLPCSLVCRAWRNRSQYNLFRSLHIVSRATHDTRAVQLHRHTVFDFLQSNPRLAGLVVHLIVSRWAATPATWLPVFLSQADRLRMLTMEGYAFKALLADTTSVAALDKIRALRLLNVDFDTLPLFAEAMRPFSHLESLHAQIFEPRRFAGMEVAPPTFSQCVIRLWPMARQSLCSWITMHLERFKSVELVIVHVRSDTLDALRDHVPARIKAGVNHVICEHLVESDVFYTEDIAQQLSSAFTSYTALTTLTINFNMSSSTTVAHAIARFARLFEPAAPPVVAVLKKLNLRFSSFPKHVGVLLQLEYSDWAALDDALGSRRDFELASLHIDITASELGALAEDAGRMLRKALPVLDGLGRLEILFGEL